MGTCIEVGIRSMLYTSDDRTYGYPNEKELTRLRFKSNPRKGTPIEESPPSHPRLKARPRNPKLYPVLP